MFTSAAKSKISEMKDIFPDRAWELISANRKSDDLVILDVSTPGEYEDLHLEGAVNVSLFSRFFKTRLEAMDKGKTYIVYCKVGGRSKVARKLMRQLGFQTVYNLTGGTLLWEEEGLPFASETKGVNRFAFCPILFSIITVKKIKRFLQTVSARMAAPRGIATSSGQES